MSRENIIIIDTSRDGYSVSQVIHTMTVGELLSLLEDFDTDTKIYLSFDNGYTYGGINECDFTETDEETEEEEDE